MNAKPVSLFFSKLSTTKPGFIFPAFFVLYYAIGLTGYGTDNDTYAMLRAGQDLLTEGHYYPSRLPGYFFPEMVVGAASLIGEFYLTNLISALLGSGALLLFYNFISKFFNPSESLLITAIAGINPYYVIASSSTIDYVYSIFFLLAGLTQLLKNKYYYAAPLFAFAISSRLTAVIILIFIYVYFLSNNEKGNRKNLVLSFLIMALLTALLYLPSFIAEGNSFKFLAYYGGEWTFFGHLSRFIYKNIYLFGLPAALIVFPVFFYQVIKRNKIILSNKLLLFTLLLVIALQMAFFKVPVEISYLMPMLFLLGPFCLYFFDASNRKTTSVIILLLSFIYNFVNIQTLEFKRNEFEAVDAKPGMFFRQGKLLDDIYTRSRAKEFYYEYFKIKF